MPDLLTRRTLGTWQTAGANRERLVDRTGKVHAEVFRLRISGRWAYKVKRDGRTLMDTAETVDAAKERAEGVGK